MRIAWEKQVINRPVRNLAITNDDGLARVLEGKRSQGPGLARVLEGKQSHSPGKKHKHG